MPYGNANSFSGCQSSKTPAVQAGMCTLTPPRPMKPACIPAPFHGNGYFNLNQAYGF